MILQSATSQTVNLQDALMDGPWLGEPTPMGMEKIDAEQGQFPFSRPPGSTHIANLRSGYPQKPA
jgi:hypothetical protein